MINELRKKDKELDNVYNWVGYVKNTEYDSLDLATLERFGVKLSATLIFLSDTKSQKEKEYKEAELLLETYEHKTLLETIKDYKVTEARSKIKISNEYQILRTDLINKKYIFNIYNGAVKGGERSISMIQSILKHKNSEFNNLQ